MPSRELERVGDRPPAILRAAEQTARELRGAAKRDADDLVAWRGAEADSSARRPSEFATSARLTSRRSADGCAWSASQAAEEAVREADSRAESIVESAAGAGGVLDAQVDELAERRDAILAEVSRLADELRPGRARSSRTGPARPSPTRRAERPTTRPRRPSRARGATLLVDPDEDAELEAGRAGLIEPGDAPDERDPSRHLAEPEARGRRRPPSEP